jgi:hypothetical protein
MGKQVVGAYATQDGVPDSALQLPVLHHFHPYDNSCNEIYGYWLVDVDLYQTLVEMPVSGRSWRVEARGKMEFAVWTEPARKGEIGRKHYLHEEIWALRGFDPPLPTHMVGFVNLDYMDCRTLNLCVKWLPKAVRVARGLLDPEAAPEIGLKKPRWMRDVGSGCVGRQWAR